MTVIVIIWIALAIGAGAAAKSRGRDPVGWFLLALIVSPILAFIMLIAFRPKLVGPTKICQFCRSEVSAAAIACPHCQREIDSAEAIEIRKDAKIRRENRGAYVGLGIVAVFVLGSIAIMLASKPV